MYQGSTAEKEEVSIGLSADVVMKLASTLETNKNFKLFADDYFSPLPLVNALKLRSIWYV